MATWYGPHGTAGRRRERCGRRPLGAESSLRGHPRTVVKQDAESVPRVRFRVGSDPQVLHRARIVVLGWDVNRDTVRALTAVRAGVCDLTFDRASADDVPIERRSPPSLAESAAGVIPMGFVDVVDVVAGKAPVAWLPVDFDETVLR